MSFQKYRPVLEAVLLSILVFVGHLAFFSFSGIYKTQYFLYSLPQLYGFFFGCSIVILLVLIRMKQKNIDSVGNTFMLLTCVKMVLAYLLLHPILNATHPEVASEKANFFFIFAIFLTIETIVTIRMLNKTV